MSIPFACLHDSAVKLERRVLICALSRCCKLGSSIYEFPPLCVHANFIFTREVHARDFGRDSFMEKLRGDES